MHKNYHHEHIQSMSLMQAGDSGIAHLTPLGRRLPRLAVVFTNNGNVTLTSYRCFCPVEDMVHVSDNSDLITELCVGSCSLDLANLQEFAHVARPARDH